MGGGYHPPPMVDPDPSAALSFWHDFAPAFWHPLTRLGEAQLLLPALLLTAVLLLRSPGGGRLVSVWLATTGAAALLTTATKVAFIGYGIGYAPLDFTGISGHAMFAAAVLPPLVLLAGRAGLAAGVRSTGGLQGADGVGGSGGAGGRGHHRGLLLVGYALAGAVAVSRVRVGAHSWSEVAAGAALGALCSGAALASCRLPALRPTRWVSLALVAWGVVAVAAAPPSTTHDLVTRLALAQSGRAQPYQRGEMQRAYRLRQPGADRLRPPAAGLAPALGAGAGSLQPH